ncbi:hypothetical protein INR49_016073 [Caranx melampygus]|nr:hypothetical protein INR49_016073 [Caranx melampygus]
MFFFLREADALRAVQLWRCFLLALSKKHYFTGNKENAQPVHGSKAIIKRDKTALAPFNLKSNEKEETLAKNVPLKAKAKQASTSGDALKKNRPSNTNQYLLQEHLPGFQDSGPKAKIPVAEKKVNKPPVSSTLSQYRFTKETAEEKRAKLAAWQASKGKTFKRPAMTTAPLPKTKVSKPVANLKSQSQIEPQPQPATQHTSEPSLEAREPDVNSADTQGAESTTCNQTPVVMNTTLELLENSEDLLDPQCTMDDDDDVVVNLCEALEAMATLSACSDELPQVSDECNVKVEDDKPNTECGEETVGERQDESQDVCEQQKVEQNETEISDGDKAAEKDDAEEVESDDDDDYESDDVMETTPPMEGASEIKYSVKTTPYLQSVKKLIEDEVSTSRRKSNIKDLKFLTPVRRSSRIQRKSSQLPTMLVDHDPCVSSLAELVKLNDDANAYIYRKNPALLHDLPDQTSL